jgi:hypothetical protein
MLILGIDPGLTTGACALNVSKSGFIVVTALEIPWDARFESLKALIDGTFFNTKQPQPPVAVVIETFRLRQARALQQTGSDFPSSQVTGIVQAFLWLDKLDPFVSKLDYLLDPEITPRPYGLERLHFQEPIMMKQVAIADADKHWVEGSEHKKDAYRHARYYYLTQVRQWP